jgi:hypothetical protein
VYTPSSLVTSTQALPVNLVNRWLPELELPCDLGTVDLSSVVCVSNKNGMINPKWLCVLCGLSSGLKMKCDRENCNCEINGVIEKLTMHVTCARQAGLEVRADDKRVNKKGGPLCYGMFFCQGYKIVLAEPSNRYPFL